MGDACSEKSGDVNETGDTALPAVTASLEMLTVDSKLSTKPAKRILKSRAAKTLANENLNRRCSLKPRKRTYSSMESEDSIKDYYLDKNIKKAQNTLETIYEEKDGTSENVTFSAKRCKRMIQFQDSASDSKIKKRRAKIKKAFGSKMFFKRTLLYIRDHSSVQSMQALRDRLNEVKVDSPTKTDNSEA